MKKILGVTFGGLQKRMVGLVMSVLFLTIAVFSVISFGQERMLVNLVENTRVEQQNAISEISQESMFRVLEDSYVRTTGLEAELADNEFAEVVTDVTMLQNMAQDLFKSRDTLTPAEIGPPELLEDGVVSAFVLSEAGIDYTQSEYIGIVAHMKDTMIALLNSSDKLSSCFIGLADGTHLAADRTTAEKFDENGQVRPLAVRQRPWYRGAVEKGGVYFTGFEKDAYDGELLVTCSVPIVVDDKIMGVAAIDIMMENMGDFVNGSSGEGGFVFVVNDKGQIILAPEENRLFDSDLRENSDNQWGIPDDLRESDNEELAQVITDSLDQGAGMTTITINGREYYIAGMPMPTVGWAVILAVEKEITEAPEKQLLSEYDEINEKASTVFREGSAKTLRTTILVTLLIVLIGSYAALVAARKVVRPIEEMTKDINYSSATGQPFVMKDSYRTDDEIEALAQTFADQSRKLKLYIENITEITREKERVSTELQMANRIQASMVPGVFPPFPDRREFDIYASMGPAREVGGDFYDFYLIDEDHLCMVMADVSGKGVPAALFMMISKVILQSCAMLGKSAAEILIKTNEAICSSNQVEMFVTVWLGILEISTGKITAANAGHEYPALMQDGKFSLLKDRHGLVIGGIEGVVYHEYEIDLKPGDKLFLYTDGIPEASDEDYKMFGVDEMVDALNKDPSASPREILQNVQDAVENFVNGAEQFDDMTMLCLEYKGKSKISTGDE